jgi:hypothetical protein
MPGRLGAGREGETKKRDRRGPGSNLGWTTGWLRRFEALQLLGVEKATERGFMNGAAEKTVTRPIRNSVRSLADDFGGFAEGNQAGRHGDLLPKKNAKKIVEVNKSLLSSDRAAQLSFRKQKKGALRVPRVSRRSVHS